MRKIVVGIDGSSGATEALRFALEEADASGAAVTAVTAWDVPPGSYGGPKSVVLAHEFFERDGQEHLDRCLESVGAAHPASLWSRGSSKATHAASSATPPNRQTCSSSAPEGWEPFGRCFSAPSACTACTTPHALS